MYYIVTWSGILDKGAGMKHLKFGVEWFNI